MSSIIWKTGLLMGAEPPIAKPGCRESCANVSIPYPFGIGSGCYHDPAYEIICNSSVHPLKPFLSSLNLEVEEITLKHIYGEDNFESIDDDQIQTIRVKTPVERTCGIQNANISSLNFRGKPYWFSGNDNVFVVRGCGSTVILRNASNDVQDGCSLLCDGSHVREKVSPFCVGIECCTLYPGDMDSYSFNILDDNMVPHNCTSIMLVSELFMDKMELDDPSSLNLQLTTVSTTLGWMLPNSSSAMNLISSVGFGDHSTCHFYLGTVAKMETAIKCMCDRGYHGNPYIRQDVKVIHLPLMFATVHLLICCL